MLPYTVVRFEEETIAIPVCRDLPPGRDFFVMTCPWCGEEATLPEGATFFFPDNHGLGGRHCAEKKIDADQVFEKKVV